ncbi:MAG: hypothetical protein QOI54_485 [Actinomycetota bacterium]|jgi:hypothetical protein|nr:hypothetical protein [Actinomycetota bacterium]
MALQVVSLAHHSTHGLRLKEGAVAVPALASHVRPALVLAERETRELLSAAEGCDVRQEGRFSSGPAGIQVWDRPFDGPGGSSGSARHLGSIDWIYDTPTKHYVTIYRAMVTQAGCDSGQSPLTILAAVLALTGLSADGNRVTLPAAPARDPFRALVSA